MVEPTFVIASSTPTSVSDDDDAPTAVGGDVGRDVGAMDGIAVGTLVGVSVGAVDGIVVGTDVGSTVGVVVGVKVG